MKKIASRAALALLTLVLTGAMSAQEAAATTAPVDEDAPAPPNHWERTNIAFGLSTYSGETNSAQVIAQLNSTLQLERLEWDAVGNFGLARAEGQKDLHQEELDWAIRYSLRPRSKWFAMVHTWYEHDEIAGIDLRASVGPGIGAHLIDTVKMRLTLEGGLAATIERQDRDQEYVAAFLDPSIRWIFNEKVNLQQKANIRYNTSDSEDIRVYWQSDLNLAVTKRIGVGFGVTVDFDNLPVGSRSKTDVQTSTHLTIALGKLD